MTISGSGLAARDCTQFAGDMAARARVGQLFVFREALTGNGYTGELDDKQRRHGVGAFASHNGRQTYRGWYREDRRHGYGTLTRTSHDGALETRYEGAWADNVQHGYGELHDLSNGDDMIFRGAWKRGQRDGLGTQMTTTADGSLIKYEGNWHADQYHGKGTLTDGERGETYTGQFQHGIRSGWGQMLRDGLGLHLSPGDDNFVRFSGQWEADVPDGPGVATYESGEQVTGYWRAGRRNGLAVVSRDGVPDSVVRYVDGTQSGSGGNVDAASMRAEIRIRCGPVLEIVSEMQGSHETDAAGMLAHSFMSSAQEVEERLQAGAVVPPRVIPAPPQFAPDLAAARRRRRRRHGAASDASTEMGIGRSESFLSLMSAFSASTFPDSDTEAETAEARTKSQSSSPKGAAAFAPVPPKPPLVPRTTDKAAGEGITPIPGPEAPKAAPMVPPSPRASNSNVSPRWILATRIAAVLFLLVTLLFAGLLAAGVAPDASRVAVAVGGALLHTTLSGLFVIQTAWLTTSTWLMAQVALMIVSIIAALALLLAVGCVSCSDGVRVPALGALFTFAILHLVLLCAMAARVVAIRRARAHAVREREALREARREARAEQAARLQEKQAAKLAVEMQTTAGAVV